MLFWGKLKSLIWDSGGICVSLAAFIFSLSGLLVKLLHGHIPEFEIVVVRSFLSFLACVLAYHKSKKEDKRFFGQLQNVPLLLGRALTGSVAMALYYFSIGSLPLADAVTLFFLNPAITAVLAWPILKEPLGFLGIAGVSVSALGVVLVAQPPALFARNDKEPWSTGQTIGTICGISSAFLASAAFIFIRLIGKKETPITMSVYFHSTAFFTSGIPLVLGFPRAAVLPNPIAVLLLLGIAVSSFWGQLLIGRALQLLNAAHASSINITQVLYSYMFGVLILHEHLSWLSILGSVFIALGVVCVSFKSKKPESDYAPVNTSEDTIAEGGPDAPSQRRSVELEANSSPNGLGQKWKQGQGSAHPKQPQPQQQLVLPAMLHGGGSNTMLCDLDTPPGSPTASRRKDHARDGDGVGGVQMQEQAAVQSVGEGEQGDGSSQIVDLFGVLLGPMEGHEAGLHMLMPQDTDEEREGQLGGDGRSRADPERGEGGT